MKLEFKRGLEGVVATETAISSIDGKKGILKYRGYNIKELAKFSDFEEVIYLLWFEKLPKKNELKKFTARLRSQRKLDKPILEVLKTCSDKITAMDALRTATSYLAHCDPDLNETSREANIRKAIRLTAKFPTIVANFWRIKQNKKIIQPDKNFSHGENFLYMLTGKKPKSVHAKAIETDFLLTAEHGMNASTFTTRVSTSTLTDLHSAITAGLCALKGPLHGAAREEIYKIIEGIKTPKNARKYVLKQIANKEKIMGFGHRVYKTYDPRARIFKHVVLELAKDSNDFTWYDISDQMEETVLEQFVHKMNKPIYPNVDFYTGAVYKYLNIPMKLATSIFAIGRISGWTAHYLEQYYDNRLIRPLGRYVGPGLRHYVPINKR